MNYSVEIPVGISRANLTGGSMATKCKKCNQVIRDPRTHRCPKQQVAQSDADDDDVLDSVSDVVSAVSDIADVLSD